VATSRKQSRATRKRAVKKTGRKPAARTAGAKRAAGKRAPGKSVVKAAARKGRARKALARKGAAKRAAPKFGARKVARRSPARSARRPMAAKAAARKVSRKAAAKRTPARKPAAARKAVRKQAGKVAARKAPAKKAVARKAVARKAPARRPAPRVQARPVARPTPPPAAARPAVPLTPPAAARPAPAPAPPRPAPGAPTAVGFIGLGTMGMPQALNLAKAGRRVVVYDANPQAMQTAARTANVEVAESPRAVAERSAVVFTCLPDDRAVDQVFRGEAGILQAVRAGLITCDLSTVSPEFTEGLDAELRRAGAIHFTAPMLGSKPQAEAGQVFYILGGPAEHLAKLAPYLAQAGRQHIHVGTVSAANKVKLLHNALGSVNYAAVAEALALCAQSGVNLRTFYEVVRNGGGMAFGNYFERKVPTIIKGDYTPRFKLKLAHKDSQLAKAFFAGTGVPTPIHDAARRLLEEGLAAGHGEDDASAVTKIVERRIGKRIVQD